MYKFYLDGFLLPVAPGKMDLKIKNKNKSIVLLNEGEINILKTAGLTEISFDIFAPSVVYPFAINSNTVDDILSVLKNLKTSKRPFQFVVIRGSFSTNIKVSVEDYSIKEDAKNGKDVYITVKLKQFRSYGTKKIKLPEKKKEEKKVKAQNVVERVDEKKKPFIGCNVIVNGRLHRDSYGEGPGQTLSGYKGKINFINDRRHGYHVTTPDGSWLGWVTIDDIEVV